jgi:O-antigen ligase
MAARTPSISTVVVAAVPLVFIPSLGAVQGGYLPATWVWATPLAAWAVALSALFGGAGALRREWPWAAAALGLLAWTAASVVWSADASQSWLEVRRMVLYAAVVLALLSLARRCAATVLVLAAHAGIVLLLAYALARYLLGARRIDPFEGGLLSQPLGYANAIGILAAMGLLLGLGIAVQNRSAALRAAGAGSLPLLALALALTDSRGSWAALATGAVVLVALTAWKPVLRVAVTALPGAAILVALQALLHLTAQDAPPSRASGALVAAAAVACSAATALAGARSGPREPVGSLERRRSTVALLATAAVLGIAAIALAGRTEPRTSYWRVAWRQEIVSHPALGTGAGTFGRAWVDSGLDTARGGALDAHSLYLETTAELGLVGLALLAAFLLLPVVPVVRGRQSGAAAAAASAYAAFLVHAGLDWDWELPAVVIAALACAAALLLEDREQPPPPPPPIRAALVVIALVLGGAGIAGTRSATVPAAAGQQRAPTPRGPFRAVGSC